MTFILGSLLFKIEVVLFSLVDMPIIVEKIRARLAYSFCCKSLAKVRTKTLVSARSYKNSYS